MKKHKQASNVIWEFVVIVDTYGDITTVASIDVKIGGIRYG